MRIQGTTSPQAINQKYKSEKKKTSMFPMTISLKVSILDLNISDFFITVFMR